MYDHSTYLSPFTWRYGSADMRRLWSEFEKRKLWRQIWAALAEAQAEAGLISREQAADVRAHVEDVDIERAHAIEAEIKHDLMAEIKAYAEQCPVGGGIIHLGATSADIEDNADALRLRDSLDLLLSRMRTLLLTLAGKIYTEAEHVCMAFTHIQPAEPTTVGYRLAVYTQDLLTDYETLKTVRSQVRGKGLTGAVGTSASYAELLVGTQMTPAQLQARVMKTLKLEAYPVTTQIYPRKQDWTVLNALAGLGISVYKLAFDLRVLQSPAMGEWAEPFAASQVGSSAMPFKRNPINAENIDSLARYLAVLPQVAWGNAADNLLERTLDDSANRRIILPSAFLAADEIVVRSTRVLAALRIDETAIARNLSAFGVFAATERLLMAAVRAGGDRQALHEIIRGHSLAAWEALQRGQPNPLAEALIADPRITTLLPSDQARTLLNAQTYTGDAPARARAMAKQVQAALGEDSAEDA